MGAEAVKYLRKKGLHAIAAAVAGYGLGRTWNGGAEILTNLAPVVRARGKAVWCTWRCRQPNFAKLGLIGILGPCFELGGWGGGSGKDRPPPLQSTSSRNFSIFGKRILLFLCILWSFRSKLLLPLLANCTVLFLIQKIQVAKPRRSLFFIWLTLESLQSVSFTLTREVSSWYRIMVSKNLLRIFFFQKIGKFRLANLVSNFELLRTSKTRYINSSFRTRTKFGPIPKRKALPISLEIKDLSSVLLCKEGRIDPGRKEGIL